MRRTWIGAAAAAGITTVAATGLALAQEKQDQQAPQTQHMEKAQPGKIEKGQRAAEPGAGQTERRMGAQAQEEKPQAGTAPGQVGAQNEPGAQAQPPQNRQAEQPENRQGEKARTGQAGERERTQSGQAAAPENRQGEKPMTGQAGERERMQSGQAAAPENRRGEQAQTGQAGERERMQSGQAVRPETRQGSRMQTGQGAGAGSTQRPNAMGARPAGNAVASGNVHISSANASQVADALMSTGRSQPVNVAVNVGAPLPGDIDLLPLPPAIVTLVPEFQGDEYVVVNDEIVIVQPSTRMVVETIRPGGVAEAPSGPPPAVNLTDAQRHMLLEGVRGERLPQAQIAELADGETVPQDVELAPVPGPLAAQIPMIERYRLFLLNDQVVLVDPDTREVIDIVR